MWLDGLRRSFEQDRRLWLWLAVFLMGIGMFEATSKVVVHRETVYGDFSSLTHVASLSLATAGLCVAMYACTVIYTEIQHVGKAELNTFPRHSIIHELPKETPEETRKEQAGG